MRDIGSGWEGIGETNDPARDVSVWAKRKEGDIGVRSFTDENDKPSFSRVRREGGEVVEVIEDVGKLDEEKFRRAVYFLKKGDVNVFPEVGGKKSYFASTDNGIVV